MNKEIEELLNTMKDKECYYVGTNGCLYQDLTKEEIGLLLSCIEQLEKDYKKEYKENYEKSEQIIDLKYQIKQLEKENEKANKYIDFYKDLTEKQNKSLEEFKQENKQLQNNRDKAIEFIDLTIKETEWADDIGFADLRCIKRILLERHKK